MGQHIRSVEDLLEQIKAHYSSMTFLEQRIDSLAGKDRQRAEMTLENIRKQIVELELMCYRR